MDRAEIIGNLTRDPELRTTQTGINVCSFTVAVNKPQTRAQREAGQQPQAKFYRVSAWRELGENCAKYLAKGRKVYVEGRIDVSAYDGNDGKPRGSLELTADQVEFLTAKGDSDSTQSATPAAQSATSPSSGSSGSSGFTPVEVEEDELPF